jgi:hypothetical protein
MVDFIFAFMEYYDLDFIAVQSPSGEGAALLL